MRNRLRILETKKPRWWQLSERNHAQFCHKQLVVPRVSVHPRILRNNHNNKNRQWRPCYRHPHHLMQSARRPSHERIWFGGNNPGQPGRRMVQRKLFDLQLYMRVLDCTSGCGTLWYRTIDEI